MSAVALAKAIRDLQTSADLLLRASRALTEWNGHDPCEDERAAGELYFRALALRLVLETELRERVMH